jgi:ketohexokinase
MRILAVGTATLDIVNRVPVYPQEDQELRATQQRIRCGGNACNTLTVLSRLGHEVSWAGVLADDASGERIRKELIERGIDLRWAKTYLGGVTPTSYITSSEQTGSRTIVHYRSLPEYDASYFFDIDLAPYHWIHFEGRHPSATQKMLQHARRVHRRATRSLELEKHREGLERCLTDVDVVMIAKQYALSKQCQEAKQIFDLIRPMAGASALLYLAWGDQGAWCQPPEGPRQHQPACQPSEIVDTLGAGDVFNAGLIHGLQQGNNPLEALNIAIQMAGEKCGRYGMEDG